MELHDFVIDRTFWTVTGRWHVLDVGNRTVIAISDLEKTKAIAKGCWSWDEMLVYASIFDLNDIGGCSTTRFT